MSQDGFILSSAQAHEIEIAMNRSQNGTWTPELVHLLTKGNQLGQLRQVLLGHASITVIENIIDCDAEPFNPWAKDGWTVEHDKGGQFKWDREAQKDALWLAKGQQNGKWMKGHDLYKEVAKKHPLNANVLDFLLANPHLIPEEWKGKYIPFWGTRYRYRGEDLYVRYLYWNVGRWRWGRCWVGLGFFGLGPAALPAS
jgi:hypothetical protein